MNIKANGQVGKISAAMYTVIGKSLAEIFRIKLISSNGCHGIRAGDLPAESKGD
jgi:hypothetical protein